MQGAAANQLEALKGMSKVVADTGDLDAIKKYQPYDATTNPSLVLKAMSLPDYKPLLGEVIAQRRAAPKWEPGQRAGGWSMRRQGHVRLCMDLLIIELAAGPRL